MYEFSVATIVFSTPSDWRTPDDNSSLRLDGNKTCKENRLGKQEAYVFHGIGTVVNNSS